MDITHGRILKANNNAISMEFVLAKAKAAASKPALSNTEFGRLLTDAEIQKKLDDAADRRRTFREERITLASKVLKIEAAAARREAMMAKFVRAAKETLEQKIETAEGNRMATLNALQERVRVRFDKIQEICQSKENDELEQSRLLQISVDEKLNQASAKREKLQDEKYQELVKRLQAHEESFRKSNLVHLEELELLKEKINEQLVKASENRDAAMKDRLEFAKMNEKKVEAVRQKKEVNKSGSGEDLEH